MRRKMMMIRLAPHEARLIAEAARLAGQRASSWVREIAVAAAKAVVGFNTEETYDAE
jgi:uncharacterized protein (DUF1778 family)